MTYDTMLLNLRIISRIPEGGKVCMSKDVFVIEETYLTSVYRFINGYNRHKSINEIHTVITDCINRIRDLYSSIYYDKDVYPVEYAERNTKITNLSNSLVFASSGLENLRQTYHKDHVCSSKIDIIIQEIKTFLPEITEFIKK